MVMASIQGTEQKALLYERNTNGTWVAAGKITISNPHEIKAGLPYEVALTEEFVIVGVCTDVIGNTLVAKVFKKHNGSWMEYVNLRADPLKEKGVNFKVRTDGKFVFVGRIYGPDGGSGDMGEVYAYDLSQIVNHRKHLQ